MKSRKLSCLAIIAVTIPSVTAIFVSPVFAQVNQNTDADAAASSNNTFFSGPQNGGASTIIQPTTVTNSSTILPTGAQNPVGGGEVGYSCPSPSLSLGGSASGRVTNQSPFGSLQVALSIPLGSSADCKKGLASKVRQDQVEAQMREEGLRQREFETALKESEWQLKLASQKLELFKQCAAVSKETGVAVALLPGCSDGLSVATKIPAPPPIRDKFVPSSQGLENSFSTDTPRNQIASPAEALARKDAVKPKQENEDQDRPKDNEQGAASNGDSQSLASPSATPSGTPSSATPSNTPSATPKSKPAIDSGIPLTEELDPSNGGIEITVN